MIPTKNPIINGALEILEDTVLAQVTERREAYLSGCRNLRHGEVWE
jgi:hypothetical protein